jgi:hypothetical protein
VLCELGVPLVTEGIDIRGARRKMGPQTKAGVDRAPRTFFENHAMLFERYDHDIVLF